MKDLRSDSPEFDFFDFSAPFGLKSRMISDRLCVQIKKVTTSQDDGFVGGCRGLKDRRLDM